MDVVEPVWDVSGSCEVGYGWCDRFPDGACRIKDWKVDVRCGSLRLPLESIFD